MNMNCEDNNECPRGLTSTTNFEHDAIISSRLQPDGLGGFTINNSDVLCGRGKLSFNHVGNKRFRDLVADAVDNYNNAISRLEKAAVVNSIVDEIRAAGGRFLRRDDDEGTWHALSYTQCREKVGHAIRDATSSVEARKKRKEQQEAAKNNETTIRAIYKSEGTPPPNQDTPLAISDMNFGSTKLDPSKNYSLVSLGEDMFAGIVSGSTSASTTNSSSLQANIDSIVRHYGNTSPFRSKDQAFETTMAQQQQFNRSPMTDFSSKETEEDLLSDDITATRVWRSNVARASNHSSAASNDDDSETDDEQFIAYIDHVLGPLPPDAARTQEFSII